MTKKDALTITETSQEVIKKGEENGLWPKDLKGDEKKQLAYISTQYGLDPFFNELIVLGGRAYVTHDGLIRTAHEDHNPPVSIQVEPAGCDKSRRHWEYKAMIWKKDTPDDRPYVEYGEASPQDVNKMLAKTDKDVKAMARTRAINRAIRLAYRVSITSAEEISGYNPNKQDIEDVEGVNTEKGQSQARNSSRGGNSGGNNDTATKKQVIKIFTMGKAKGLEEEEIKEFLRAQYGVESSAKMTKKDISDAIVALGNVEDPDEFREYLHALKEAV